MRPQIHLMQKEIRNPHASMPMFVPVLVLNNTPIDRLQENVRVNAAMDLEWLSAVDAHDGVAIMVGGGPSAEDHIEEIKGLSGTVFALNGASRWLRSHGVECDYQVMVDAKPESAALADPMAKAHLFGSQVDPATMRAVERPIVWHTCMDGIEDCFPESRRKAGGYPLLGGTASVGNSAMCVAYALGFRRFICLGYDSSNKGEETHAYSQPMNFFIPTVEYDWNGRTYTCSVAMKLQAEQFQIMARELLRLGCEIEVRGYGLLPAMWNTKPSDMSERDKYRTIWQLDAYRDFSPGEVAVAKFLSLVDERGSIIDFGCGTGRASLALKRAGFSPLMLDFADNCRDDEAKGLPFIDWDLTKPCHLRAPFGFCTDVMEHIPTEDVPLVLDNIMASAGKVFFQISTVVDVFGDVIGARLHHTVKPHGWWAQMFSDLGFRIEWQQEEAVASQFLIATPQT